MIWNCFLLFGCTFGVVLALTAQTMNIGGNHRALAVATSFLIGALNLAILKIMPQQTSAAEILAYLTGGPVGVLVAMHWHPSLVAMLQRMNRAGKPTTDREGAP